MTRAQRKHAKLSLSIACLAWVVGAGWVAFNTLPDDAIQNHTSAAVKQQMKDECQGSFKQRYDCKEAIVIEKSRETFWTLTERLALVVVPALVVGIVGSMAIRRIPVEKPVPQVHQDDWKVRAQNHISHPQYPPQSSGQE